MGALERNAFDVDREDILTDAKAVTVNRRLVLRLVANATHARKAILAVLLMTMVFLLIDFYFYYEEKEIVGGRGLMSCRLDWHIDIG